LPGGWILEAGYLGSKGQHLPDGESNMPITQLPASYFALGAQLDAQVPNPFYHVAGVNTTSNLYTQPTTKYSQLLSPYPQYAGVTAFRIPQANSNYQALTFEVNKRFSRGLQLLFSFTGGKLLDDASQQVSFLGAAGSKQDYFNRAGDKAISSQDVSKRMVISFNYDIPFGKGRPLLGSLRVVGVQPGLHLGPQAVVDPGGGATGAGPSVGRPGPRAARLSAGPFGHLGPSP
jgi:hypothetical protein